MPILTGLLADHQQYVCAELDHAVMANREALGPWEEWTVEPQTDGSVALRSDHGLYLSAQPDQSMVADRKVVGPWECFRYEPQPDGRVAFRSWMGLYVCADPTGYVTASRAYETPGPWECFSVTPWWEAPHPGPDPEPVPDNWALQGPLEASYDRGLCDATGPRLAIVCHAGDLLSRFYRDREGACRRLDEIAGARYHAVRTWTILWGPYWQSFTGELHPGLADYWAVLDAFVEELKDRGLRWLVSQGDLMRWAPTTQGRRDYMRELGRHLQASGGAAILHSVDAANEGGNNGEGNASALADALQAFLQECPTPIHVLTSASEEQPNVYLVQTCARDIHSSRGPWPMPGRRCWNMQYEATPRAFTVQSEGPGQGVQEYPGDRRVGHHVSATDRPNEWNDGDPEIVGVLAALHLGKQQYVYFSSPGVISDEPFGNYAAFRRMPRLLMRLPRDLGTWRLFHGGENRPSSPERVVAVPADDNLNVRCDHAMSGSRRLCVVYGPAGTYRLKVINHFTGVIIHPGDLHETEVQWRAGSTQEFSFKRGRILLGEVH